MRPHNPGFNGKTAPVPWYFVCVTCSAKWFAETQRTHCPRCQTPAVSVQRITPPWWHEQKSETEPTAAASKHHK